jgi:hypothetical protein
MNIAMRTFIFSARSKKIAIGEEELDGLLLDAVRKAIEPGNPSPLDQLPMATNDDRLTGPFIPSKAADRGPERTLHWPNHRPARPVRLGDNSIIGDVDPFVIETDAIMAFVGFPIDVG